MTDRKLLELAAKAAGVHAVSSCAFGDSDVVEKCKLGLWNRERGGVWNPLTDDGDALRLAVKLRLHVDHSRTGDVTVWVMGKTAVSFDEDQADPYASTRRAIVRAAAAIGQSQPAIGHDTLCPSGSAE